ncbi:DUF4232 domain-containing protein [Streptosporangium sp. NPDC051023]|uniref:DUF4232 domain-containing protein n=1 Tax=Streptosporangium sp. NPDC051023 TaxID=3155410 RepID=UPI00344C4A08
MERNNRVRRLTAISLATAGTLMAVAACASPAQPGIAASPAGSAAVRPAEHPADTGTRAGATGTRATGTRATGTRATGTRATGAKDEDARTGAAGAASGGAGLPTGKAAAGRCRTEGLKARTGEGDAGAGQRYAPLVLTNTSAKTCWVYGFVGLVMFDGNGDALRTRVRRENVPAHRVTLRPGASAHARVHWTVVPGQGESTCPSMARLMIIPPDEVAHLEIPFAGMVCGDGRLDITPMTAGARL